MREKLKEEIDEREKKRKRQLHRKIKRKTGIEGEKMKERERWIKRGSEMNLKTD